MKPVPSVAVFRKHLRYDAATGHLWWIYKLPQRRLDRPAGSLAKEGYRQIKFMNRGYQAHRVIWLLVTGKWPKNQIDHKNGNTSGNRWENLREANNGENHINSRLAKNNSSGYRGVVWNKKSGKWQAQIQKDKKMLYLGLFTNPQEAYAAYVEIATRLHGEFMNVR